MPERRKGTQGSKRPANTVVGKNGKPVRQSRDRFRLTALEQQIVGLYQGNWSDVAKILGKRRQLIWLISQRPIVAAAITKKEQAFIKESGKLYARDLSVTTANVLKELARLAFFDPRNLFKADGSPKHITELDDDTAPSVAGLDVQEIFEGSGQDKHQIGVIKKYKIADKGQNLERLGKHLGMFIDRFMDLPPGFATWTTEQQESYCKDGKYPGDSESVSASSDDSGESPSKTSN